MSRKKSPPDKKILPAQLERFITLRETIEVHKREIPQSGRPPKITSADLIAGLVWHVMQPDGTLSNSLDMYCGKRLADSSLSQRRQTLGTKPWHEAMNRFLDAERPKDGVCSTYKGFRLTGVDGTTFNVGNTPAMNKSARKTKTRRGSAAFHRLSCVALYDLDIHYPRLVKIGEQQESEMALASQVLENLRPDDLLIADRYYGNGKLIANLLSLPQKPLFLVRVQERFKAKRIRKYSDGSLLVEVKDPVTNEWVQVREIKAKVRRSGKKGKWSKVRFWTNLFDAKRYPAKEVVTLYAMRWEHEIAYRELKTHLHGKLLLSSHTLPTATQEICALFMAQAVLNTARQITADKWKLPVLQISFQKSLSVSRHLCWLWATVGEKIGRNVWLKISQEVALALARQASKPRRARSCPRKVRQPIQKWHRLLVTNYEIGKFEYKLRVS